MSPEKRSPRPGSNTEAIVRMAGALVPPKRIAEALGLKYNTVTDAISDHREAVDELRAQSREELAERLEIGLLEGCGIVASKLSKRLENSSDNVQMTTKEMLMYLRIILDCAIGKGEKPRGRENGGVKVTFNFSEEKTREMIAEGEQLQIRQPRPKVIDVRPENADRLQPCLPRVVESEQFKIQVMTEFVAKRAEEGSKCGDSLEDRGPQPQAD
jgi:hypothetical protein